MTVVTVSSKYQVVIPKEIRESLDIRPGQKVRVLRYGNLIEIIPERPMTEARGLLRGMDGDLDREEDRV